MGQLDASIVTLTFRPMEHDFAEPPAAVQWVSLAYLLLLVALVTPAGPLADSAGRKLIHGYGFVVFTIGSAACGLAPSLGVLIGSRSRCTWLAGPAESAWTGRSPSRSWP